jgi:hypothetical protein
MLTNPEEEEGVTASLEADRHRSSVLVALSRRSGRTSALPYPPLRRLVAKKEVHPEPQFVNCCYLTTTVSKDATQDAT